MKMYRIFKGYSPDIEEIDVVKTTAKTVVWQKISPVTDQPYELREHRSSEYHEWFDTWDEARDRLMQIAEARLSSARRRLQEAQEFHGNVKGMKKPEGVE